MERRGRRERRLKNGRDIIRRDELRYSRWGSGRTTLGPMPDPSEIEWDILDGWTARSCLIEGW